MTEGHRTKDKGQIIWLLFAILIVAVYFWGLNIPLLGPDEPRYSQVAREMFERSDWITPRLGGYDWFEKPALLYWLQIASYHLFGVTEFAARFGSAIFGLGTILSLWILGKRWTLAQNASAKTDSPSILYPLSFANWLALISASSLGLIVFSHAASFDIILTFPVTASLIGFFIFELTQNNSSGEKLLSFRLPVLLPLCAFYFFIGIALIAKGLIGIVFPFAIVAFYHVLSWKLPGKTFLASLFWGTIVSLIVASFWYLPMYQANGWKFIDEFFIQHHFQRYTSNKYLHPQPFYFFFWVLPLMTLPWLPFFLASIWDFIKNLFQTKTDKTDQAIPIINNQLRIFAFAWMLVPLVFFSLSGSKLPGYILPSVPAALILTADYIYRFIQSSAKRQLLVQLAAFLTFIGVIISLQFFVMKYASHETVKNLVLTADRDGYSDAKILNLHTISHNLEFYGAKRLFRTGDGKLERVDGVGEIVEKLNIEEKDILVVTPLEYAGQLTGSNVIEAKVLDDNGELAIVAVKLK